jgi:hypothetical protein
VSGGGQSGDATFNTTTSLGGTLLLRDSGAGSLNGGAVVFAANQGSFAAIKGQLTDGTTNSIGRLSFFTRNSTSDSALAKRMMISEIGYVSMGGAHVPVCPLDVRGSGTFGGYNNGSYFNKDSTSTLTTFGGTNNSTTNATIRADNHMWALGFAAYSDERIKTNIETVCNGLEYLRNIQPRSYSFIDTIKNSSNIDYGFIAQEVKSVLPSSVFTQIEFIPSVFKVAQVTKKLELLLDEPHKLTIGDKIKLINLRNEEFLVNVANILDYKLFSINDTSCITNASSIFVYGKEVNDYHVLKKDNIYTMGISAILELDRQVELLKLENKNMTARLLSIEQALT